MMFGKQFLTDRLYIREYKKSDLDAYVHVVRQPEIYATTYGIPREYSRMMGRINLKFIKRNRIMGTALEYAVLLRENNRYIGNVGLINISHDHNRADISYFIDKDYMNKGYATEAAAVMLNFGFEGLGYHKISGVCMSANTASRRVMEKLGMTYEGTLREDLYKDGIYYDIDRLSILRSEYFTNCNHNKEGFQHPNVE